MNLEKLLDDKPLINQLGSIYYEESGVIQALYQAYQEGKEDQKKKAKT